MNEIRQVVHSQVMNGDSADLYDVVILGDGYRAQEEAKFNTDVGDVIGYLQNNSINFPVNQ